MISTENMDIDEVIPYKSCIYCKSTHHDAKDYDISFPALEPSAMVKFYQHKYSYDYSWNTVSYAFLNRYPNPFATHVLSVDTLDHRVDTETGELFITRLLRKTNSVPRWARSIMRGNDAYILEEVKVDAEGGTLVSKTRNITHTRLMKVEERQFLMADRENASRTLCRNETSIVSNIGYGLNSKIENFSLSRFSDNLVKSRKGMLYVLDLAQRKGLFRQRLRMELPPSPSSTLVD